MASANLKIGDRLSLGRWEDEGIDWRVLDVKDGQALLITEQAIVCRRYNETRCDITWGDCSLRYWLNGEFLEGAFSDSERRQIAEASVVNEDNAAYGTRGGSDTKDHVFCLSLSEAEQYFADDRDRICYPTQFAQEKGVWTNNKGACNWWLRSPGDIQDVAARVDHDGEVYDYGRWVDEDNYGVRPSLWLKL